MTIFPLLHNVPAEVSKLCDRHMSHNAFSIQLQGLIGWVGLEETSRNADTLVSIEYSVQRDSANTKKPELPCTMTVHQGKKKSPEICSAGEDE